MGGSARGCAAFSEIAAQIPVIGPEIPLGLESPKISSQLWEQRAAVAETRNPCGALRPERPTRSPGQFVKHLLAAKLQEIHFRGEDRRNHVRGKLFIGFVLTIYQNNSKVATEVMLRDDPSSPGQFGVLQALLGCGGFSFVEACKRTSTGKRFAVKCGLMKHNACSGSFVYEAETMELAQSPYVATLHACWIGDTFQHLVLEEGLGDLSML
eukprot:s1324_g14.t4